MRYKVLLHPAVILVAVASLKIILERGTIQDFGSALTSARNFPLGAATLTSIVLLELFRRKLSTLALVLVAISGLVYFFSSLYLPLMNNASESASFLTYVSIVSLLSISLVVALGKNPGIGRISVAFFSIALLGMIVGFAYTFSDINEFRGNTVADAAVVLGGAVWGPHTPSPDLKGRLDAAAELYKKGEVKKIAVTGGTRRFKTFESEIGAWYLCSRGIPASKILTEHSTLNTSEQILYVKDVLMDSLKMRNIVIVSDAWHLPRAMLMSKWENIKVKSYASRYKMSAQAELFWRMRESAGLQIYMLFGA